MLYVLAGNYVQARHAMRGKDPATWRFVDGELYLFGVHGGSMVVVGTFWDRKDASAIYSRAKNIAMLATDPEATDE